MLSVNRLRSRSLVLPAMVALACAVGCGVDDRPPELRNRISDGGASTVQTFQPATPVPLSCNLGPNGGVCACADEPLLGDPPNLYFILDRSASMLEDDKWKTIVTVIGNLVVQLGPRARIGAAVFPSPLEDNCAPGEQIFAPTRGDAPAGKAGPVESAFLRQLGALVPNGGTPTAATLAMLTSSIESLTGKTYVILATDGGPNCNSSAMCDMNDCELNIESDAPCTPTGPTNCCLDPQYGLPTSCLDQVPTEAAVARLADDGVPVYVVGVPGSAPYAELLNDLAIAGKTQRSQPPYYYAVDSADVGALSAALSAVAASIAGTCTLSLNDVPPDPEEVNVFLDETVLPQDGPNGWTLQGNTVTIEGTSCTEIKTGAVLDVRVVAGCPTLLR